MATPLDSLLRKIGSLISLLREKAWFSSQKKNRLNFWCIFDICYNRPLVTGVLLKYFTIYSYIVYVYYLYSL